MTGWAFWPGLVLIMVGAWVTLAENEPGGGRWYVSLGCFVWALPYLIHAVGDAL